MSLASGQPAGLANLPWDVFNGIAEYLDHSDILELSYVCKGVRSLAEQSYYTLYGARVRDKKGLASLSLGLLTKPYLCDVTRSLWVGNSAPWWSLDLLSAFRALRRFIFKPEHLAGENAQRMVRTLVAGAWIQPSLRECSIDLFYSRFEDVPAPVLESLLYALLTAPELEVLTATYARDLSEFYKERFHYRRVHLQSDLFQFSFLPAGRCTNLRELHLRWDGLWLHALSKLLEMPRNLKVLHLHFGRNSPINHRGDTTTWLNTALGPVAHSLEKLVIFPIRDYKEPPGEDDFNDWMTDLRIQWGEGGLSRFKKLEYLSIPGDSWQRDEDEHGRILRGRLRLPESLTTLHLTDSVLAYKSREPPGRREPDGVVSTGLLTLMVYVTGFMDWYILYFGTRRNVQAVMDGASKLRYIEVAPSGGLDMDDIRERLPPVYLPQRMAPVVERGVKILASTPEGSSVELETRLEEN